MYLIIISHSAEKDMDKLPSLALQRIAAAIDDLAVEPRPVGCLKLKAQKENLWRVRVGDYRIIYMINDSVEIVDVRRVRHRKDVYE